MSDYALRGTNDANNNGAVTNGRVPNIAGKMVLGWDQTVGHAGSQPLGSEGTGPFRRQFRSASSETTTWAASNVSGTAIPSVLSFDGSRVSSIYVNDIGYVRPKSMTMTHIIKY